nr:histidinol-phosphate transaminase [Ezakiella coagulans]
MNKGHGANIFKYSKSGDLLDFSSNINPYGPTERVKNNIREHLDLIARYPDVSYGKLFNVLEKYLGVDKTHISLGNGAMEVIDATISLYENIVIFEPAFMEYEIRANVQKKNIKKINLDSSFKPNVHDLDFDLENTLVIITSPHNPSGVSLSKKEFDEIYEKVSNNGGAILMDEAFHEFSSVDYDLAKEISKYKNLFVVRAATKFFSLPGLRLGYLVSNFKNDIDKHIPTWSVSSLVENLGEDLLLDEEFIISSKAKLAKSRDKLFSELQKIDGIHPLPSDANYILIKTDLDNEVLFQNLLKQGILVRMCDNYANLGHQYIRIAVKKDEDNEKLLKALKEGKNGRK